LNTNIKIYIYDFPNMPSSQKVLSKIFYAQTNRISYCNAHRDLLEFFKETKQ